MQKVHGMAFFQIKSFLFLHSHFQNNKNENIKHAQEKTVPLNESLYLKFFEYRYNDEKALIYVSLLARPIS